MYTPGHKTHLGTQAAKRREADRKRKAVARAEAKDAGIPEKSLVDHAIAEASSYCINNADRRVWSTACGWSPINAAVLYAVALDVLTLQHHKDPAHSKAALNKRLGKQDGHSIPGFIPSTRPAPGQPVYRLKAPADVSAPRSSTPPLHPQDTSNKGHGMQH